VDKYFDYPSGNISGFADPLLRLWNRFLRNGLSVAFSSPVRRYDIFPENLDFLRRWSDYVIVDSLLLCALFSSTRCLFIPGPVRASSQH
jgi:hypothetical protein